MYTCTMVEILQGEEICEIVDCDVPAISLHVRYPPLGEREMHLTSVVREREMILVICL